MKKKNAPDIGLAESLLSKGIKVTKHDAAVAQLRTAIRLWFYDEDPISIHALVFAAYEIIHKLYRRKGLKNLLWDNDRIKDEYREEFSKSLKIHAAFFKHAERDLDSTILFNTDLNELFLSMSVFGLEGIDGKVGDIEAAFNFWIYLHKPHLFPEDVAEEQIPIDRLNKMRAQPKREFFDAFLKVRAEQRARGLIE